MNGGDPSSDSISQKLHQLNAKIQSDPTHKLQHIRDLYTNEVAEDESTADVILIIHSIVQAGELDKGVQVNQTDHLKAATPIFMLGMSLGTLLGIAALGVGGYAIYKNAQAATEVHLWGASISTGNVGAAIVFIGIVAIVMVIRKAFKHAAYNKKNV